MSDLDDYIKERFERACENDWFDPDGNNAVATCNRSFIGEVKLTIHEKLLQIPSLIMLKELADAIVGFIVLLSLPVTFLPIVIFASMRRRKEARKVLEFEFESKK